MTTARRQLYLLKKELSLSRRELKRKSIEAKAICAASRMYPNCCGHAFQDKTSLCNRFKQPRNALTVKNRSLQRKGSAQRHDDVSADHDTKADKYISFNNIVTLALKTIRYLIKSN